jgi:hypothetical protein
MMREPGYEHLAALADRAVGQRDRGDDADLGTAHRAARRTQAVFEGLRRDMVGRAEQGEPAGGLGQAVGLQEGTADDLGGVAEHGQRDR